MIRAIAEKKQRLALDLYYDLLALKEPPMRILFLIARQFNQLLLVKSLAAKGMDRSSIASKAQVAPFIAGRLMTQARSFTLEQLKSVLGRVEMDDAVLHPLANGKRAASPGMKYKHYSPRANVVILDGSLEHYIDYVNTHAEDGVAALCYDGEDTALRVPAICYGGGKECGEQAREPF